MASLRLLPIALCFLVTSCFINKHNPEINISSTYKPIVEEVNFFDSSRKRSVPVAFYLPDIKSIRNQKIVIISHGYAGNKEKSNLAYSYLANNLASKGYFVASIQHELPTDSLLLSTGIPQIVRRPMWERGAQNILFVLNELKRTRPQLDYKHLTLIGHSNGGDMTMLFAHKYPHLVDKAISLDNRRFALPRTKRPGIYSLRSSDQPADKNVLPTDAEQKKYGIRLVKLANTTHSQMDDYGNEQQHEEINRYILSFLNEH